MESIPRCTHTCNTMRGLLVELQRLDCNACGLYVPEDETSQEVTTESTSGATMLRRAFNESSRRCRARDASRRDTIIFSTGTNSFQSTILFDGNETVGIQHVGIPLSIIGRTRSSNSPRPTLSTIESVLVKDRLPDEDALLDEIGRSRELAVHSMIVYR
jgi:hypothetical protein